MICINSGPPLLKWLTEQKSHSKFANSQHDMYNEFGYNNNIIITTIIMIIIIIYYDFYSCHEATIVS